MSTNMSIILLLSIIGITLFVVFIFNITAKSHKDDDTKREPMLQIVRDNFIQLDPKFGNIPLYTGDSSYTEDKSVITLCTKDPHTGTVYDKNTIMFVALHELAHVITKKYDINEHGEEFRQNFSMLLNRAEKLGFYDKTKQIPPNYCGL